MPPLCTLQKRRKFAKWKANEILQAIKEGGRRPCPASSCHIITHQLEANGGRASCDRWLLIAPRASRLVCREDPDARWLRRAGVDAHALGGRH